MPAAPASDVVPRPIAEPGPDFRLHADELRRLAAGWMQSALFAQLWPHGLAVLSPYGTRSFAQLHDNANRLAHVFRGLGLQAGDALALLCRNRAEFVEVFLAAMRCGLRLTPVNTHLTANEVHYIVQDCGARVLVVEHTLDAPGIAPANVQRLVIDGDTAQAGALGSVSTFQGPSARADSIPCALTYAHSIAASQAGDVSAAQAGTLMLYTSGTTGRPKGVFKREPEVMAPQFAGSFADYRPGDMALCCGPAYHAAPLLFDIRWPLASGVPIVLVDKWDPVAVLSLIEQHRVSHVHMVPTMFQRLLALAPAARTRHDLSSLRLLLHGAAPCTVATKRAMIDWLGPVLTEYYAATEGGSGIHVDAAQWLLKPGTVGRVDPLLGHRIVDDDGVEVAPGAVGRIFFKAPDCGRFEYFGDPEKTAAAYADDRFTLGDLGYVDGDGYLFLTGRAADCIISGGVNIYPLEIDQALMRHPAVHQACSVGAPDADWGERVVAVVVPAAGHAPTPELAVELLVHSAQHLARFKCPREVVFDTALPHTGSGKLQRSLVRQRFWSGHEKSI